MSLKVASLLKQIPLPSELRSGADGLMDRTQARSTIDHDCAFALQSALAIKDRIPGAELFSRSSDFRLIGDHREVLPRLIHRVRSGFSFGVSPAERVLAAEPHP